MRLWLSPQVHAVTIASDIVFLDVASDAYLCLADAARYLQLGADGSIDIDPPQAAKDLTDAGLLAPERPTGSRRAIPPIQRGREYGGAPLSLSAMRIANNANAIAAKAIAQLPLGDILALAGGVSDSVLTAPSSAVVREANRFARMAPWLPRDGLCLMRSLQQRLYLARHGLSAAWVFGVRTWPFEAHCWLQVGDVVLDDTPEHAGAYTPILVV